MFNLNLLSKATQNNFDSSPNFKSKERPIYFSLYQSFKILPNHRINYCIVWKYWDDILRFMATIKTKTTTASQLFKRLNSYAKDHYIYRALREFGRIIKSIFILNYISDVNLRQQIEKQLNKIELSNTFSRAVFFSNNQEFRDGSKEEQILIAICKSFMQNCIILWNYLYLSQLLINKKTLEEKEQLLKIIKANSVIIGGMLIYKENMILPM